jgi:hypothetical protein
MTDTNTVVQVRARGALNNSAIGPRTRISATSAMARTSTGPTLGCRGASSADVAGGRTAVASSSAMTLPNQLAGHSVAAVLTVGSPRASAMAAAEEDPCSEGWFGPVVAGCLAAAVLAAAAFVALPLAPRRVPGRQVRTGATPTVLPVDRRGASRAARRVELLTQIRHRCSPYRQCRGRP